MNFLHTVIARLREPSSYAGLAAILGALGFNTMNWPWWNDAVAFATAGLGLLAVVLRDKGTPSA